GHMRRLWDGVLHAVVLLLAAWVMALAFPRTDWSLTPWAALVPLLALATIRSPRAAFFWGWASGTLFFAVLLRWLQFTFQVYSAIPWPLVYGPVLLLAAYCGVWTGAVAWAVSWLTARRSAALALALAPFLWVAAEWLRGHLFGGFPWGALGYSQYLHLRVIQIAELAGVHAVSFVLLAVNAALAGCVVLRWRQALVGTGAAAALLVATLVFGTVRIAEPLPVGSIDAVGDPPRFRNSAFLITDQGIVGRYDKIQLVPFGEFVPLSRVLGFVRRWAEFISQLEAGSHAVVFNAPPAPFGIVICYEGIFPDLVRQFVRDGARLMVNMTNDAWFGRTSGPEQHLTMYPFRAVEHRVSVVRAANTGVSAFIAPNGFIVRRLQLFE